MEEQKDQIEGINSRIVGFRGTRNDAEQIAITRREDESYKGYEQQYEFHGTREQQLDLRIREILLKYRISENQNIQKKETKMNNHRLIFDGDERAVDRQEEKEVEIKNTVSKAMEYSMAAPTVSTNEFSFLAKSTLQSALILTAQQLQEKKQLEQYYYRYQEQ